MNIEIDQVGKRWFRCGDDDDNLTVLVEATYRCGYEYIYNQIETEKAEYDVHDWIPIRRWTLTGKGAIKYRNQIINTLETYIEED